MPQFVNKATGDTVEFVGKAADWAVSSGQFEPVGGLLETSLGGAPALLPPEAAEFANQTAGGARSPEVLLQGESGAFDEEMWGGLGQELLTGAEGVASGATLGGSDALLSLLGAETKDRARVNPTIRTAGEIVGSLAPAAIGGLAATPAGLAMGAGRAAGRAVGGGLAGAVVGGAVEGAAFGAGQGLSNLVFANEPLTASAVVNELGMGALLGGGLGIAGGALGHGLGKVATAAGSKLSAAGERLALEGGDASRMAFSTKTEAGQQLVQRLEQNTADLQSVADSIFANAKLAGRELKKAQTGLLTTESRQLVQLQRAVQEAGQARKQYQKAWTRFGDVIDEQDLVRHTARSTPEEAAAAAEAFQIYEKSLAKLARQLPKGPEHTTALQTVVGQIEEATKAALPEGAKAVRSGDLLATIALAGGAEVALPNLDGPWDDLLKLYLARQVVRKHGGALNKLAKGVGTHLQRGIAHAAHLTGWRAGRKVGGTVASSIGSVALGSAAANATKAVMGIEGLAGATGSVLQRAGSVTSKLGKGATGIGRHGAPAALPILNAVKFGSQGEGETLQDAFALRAAELEAAFANPQATQEAVHAALAPVRATSMGVGDKLEMLAYRALDYLYKAMPKDPGNMRVLGQSVWQPDDFQCSEFASRMYGVDAPMDAVESTLGGAIDPAAMEAVRIVHPDIFAEVQQSVLENLDTLVENSTFDDRGALSCLLDVPVDSAYDPENVDFIQNYWKERDTENQQTTNRPSSTTGSSNSFTHAQQLQQ